MEVCLPVLRNATWNFQRKQYHSRRNVNTLLVIFKTNTSKAIHFTHIVLWNWSLILSFVYRTLVLSNMIYVVTLVTSLFFFFTACHSTDLWHNCHYRPIIKFRPHKFYTKELNSAHKGYYIKNENCCCHWNCRYMHTADGVHIKYHLDILHM